METKFLEIDKNEVVFNHGAEKFTDVLPAGLSEEDTATLHSLLIVCAELADFKRGAVVFILSSITGLEFESPSQLAEYLIKSMSDEQLGALVMGFVMMAEEERSGTDVLDLLKDMVGE